MKRGKLEIKKNPGVNGGYYCSLCKNDASNQPTCKEVRPNTTDEIASGYPTYRCTASKGHAGKHFACASDEARDSHYIVSWRSKTKDIVWKAKGKAPSNFETTEQEEDKSDERTSV